MLRKIAVFLFVIYAVISIGMSGYESISKIGAVAGLCCAAICFFSIEKIVLWHKLVFLNIFYFSISWLWSSSSDSSAILNFLSAISGAFAAALLIEMKWLPSLWMLRILLVPGFLNILAFYLGINLTEYLYELSFDTAFKRFGGFVGHPSILIPRVFLPLLLFILVFPDLIKKAKFDFASAFFVAGFCIFTTGSKKAILLALICLVACLFILFRGKKNSIFYIIFISPIAVILFGQLGGLDISDIESYKRLVDAFDPYDESTEERRYLFEYAMKYSWDSPFFGHGLDHFTHIFYKYSHNNFSEIFFSFGFFGLIIYYIPLAISLFNLKKFNNGNVLLLLGISIFVFLDFTGVSFLERGCQILYIIILSKFLSMSDKDESRTAY